VVATIYLFLFGLILGSFLNVCIYRLPQDQDIFFKRSSCQNCHFQIRWFHNIPLISYLFLFGKCSNCKKQISLQYPFVELLSGLIFVYSYFEFGLTLKFYFFIIFASALLVIFFTDLNKYLILDIITIPVTVLGLVVTFFEQNPFQNNLLESVAGGLAGFGSFYLIRWSFLKIKKIEAMGFGDVKLMLMLGIWLGIKSILFIMLFSSITALMVAIPLTIIKKDKRYPIPYGCFITISSFLYMWLGDSFYKILT
jgi:prepilin signal peptidase PulO-like enzyme (type II secretory pathway)